MSKIPSSPPCSSFPNSRNCSPFNRAFSKAGLALAFALSLSCSKPAASPAGPLRVALLPTENLTGDAALDGLSRAIPHIARLHLTGLASIAPVEAVSVQEAFQRQAAQVAHSWIEKSSGGLTLHAALRNAAGQTEKDLTTSAPEPSALASALAKWLDSRARPLKPIPAEAMRAFGSALTVSDRAQSIEQLKRAVTLAPDFADASLALSALQAASNDAAGAKATLESALSRNPDAIPRARIEAQLAALSGDQAKALEAQDRLSALLPAEPGLLRKSADARLARGEFPAAIEAYKKIAAAEPSNADTWNQLAFAHAYAGDEKAALGAIAHSEKAAPASANPPDSRGEIQFIYGRFREAADSFAAAYAKDAAFLQGATLIKSAQSRLFAGDTAGADRDFRTYLTGPAKGHPLAALIEAQWEFKSGKRRQAIDRLRKTPGPEALMQLAIWHLELGQRPAALEFAKQAAANAKTPAAKNEAMIALYLSQPSASIDDWRKRAGGNPPPAVLAYALIFDRKWKEAIPALTQLATRSHPFRSGQWRILLGEAHLETGNKEEAKKWLRFYPIPMSSGDAAFECTIVPKVIELRKRAGL